MGPSPPLPMNDVKDPQLPVRPAFYPTTPGGFGSIPGIGQAGAWVALTAASTA